MIDQQQASQLIGSTVVDRDGDKIGRAGQVYLDDETGAPEWVTVNTGLFGTSESFIPLADASLQGDQLRVPYEKAKVKDAPKINDDEHLSREEEDRLYEYYGLAGSGGQYTGGQTGTTTGTTTGTATGTASDLDRDGDVLDRDRDMSAGTSGSVTTGRGVVGDDVSGPETDEAMTRSREELRVGTRQQEAGRVRLRKFVTTRTETASVPVSREEVVVEREPITDANRGAAYDGPAISEEEHEVTLHEEVPVVGVEAVPVERVRVDKRTVTDQEQVSAQVREEQIEVDDASGRTGTGTGTTDRTDRI